MEVLNPEESYPDRVAERIQYEANIYDKWYRGTSQRLVRPFFYHNGNCEKAFMWALFRKYGVQPSSSVIDVGCGNGFYSNLLDSYGMKVTGIDLSEEAIRFGKNQYGEKIKWICGDVFSLKIVNPFDYVFCNFFTYFNRFNTPKEAKRYADYIMSFIKRDGLTFFIWISDLTGIRLPKERFGIMNFTVRQLEGIFGNYPVESFSIDSLARLPLCMGNIR